MTDELFQTPVEPTIPEEGGTVEEIPTLTMHEQLVGDGKKYSDNEKLAQSVDHKERYILQLQSENQGLRGELQTRVSLEEFMENQEKTRLETSTPPPLPPVVLTPTGHVQEGTGHVAETTTSPPQEIPSVTDLVAETERVLDQKLAERDAVAQAQFNLSHVKSEATKALGPEYPFLFSQKAKEMGLDQEYLNDMATKQPEVFLSLMLGQNYQKAASVAPPVTGVNAQARQAASEVTGNAGQKLSDWSHLRNDPNKYWQPNVQNQIFKAAEEAFNANRSFTE